MIDMTMNKSDKKNFITSIVPDSDYKTLKITFADGKIIEKEFSVDNYLSELKGLEKQYLEYRKEYLGKINKLFINVWSKRIIELLIAIGSVYLVANLDVSELFQNIYLILAMLYTAYAQLIGKGVTDSIKELYRHINICDDMAEGSKEFSIPVVNPSSKDVIDWPLLNLGNIEQFSSYQIELLDRITDDSKGKIGDAISRKLKA